MSGKKEQPHRSKGGSVVSQTYEFPYLREKNEKTLGQLMYDSKAGKVLGRTPKNWGELFVFYSIFYIALAALFAICMKGMMMTISESQPKWKLEESIIGTNPGVGFRPISSEVEQGSLIWYDSSNQTQVKYWTSILDEFMQDYSIGSSNQKNCDFENFPKPGQVCKVDTNLFDQCSSQNSYGYNNSSPCIFLKLNRIYGWMPDFYNDPENLPEEMPDQLKNYIKGLPEFHRNQVWVSCRGENGADLEILGDVAYFPTQGFPSYFYPYFNANGYLSPLVGVKFIRPKPNQIINIECRAWAKNIEYSGSFRDRKGSVHLELMIDAPAK